MKDEAPELKPCPFCGGDAEEGGHWGEWYVRCTNTDCWAGNHASVWVGFEDAVDAWNRRAPSPAPDVREALRKVEAVLADIAEGEPDPDYIAERIWCWERAADGLMIARAASPHRRTRPMTPL